MSLSLSLRHLIFTLCLASLLLTTNPAAAEVFELRTYTTNEGKLDNLHARFRDHTVKLFEKHGIRSLGYWVPTDGEATKNTLIYVIAHKDRDAAKESWKAFINDPNWKAVHKKSEADGPILAKAPESVYMRQTDYSPEFANENQGNDGVYELRIYKTGEGKLDGLDARFRDHTIELFNRHGIESVAYWHPTESPDSDDTLIYLVRHDSRDAAKTSWKAFGADPDWKKAAKESQIDGKFLRERPTSIYMKPTDYSAWK
ncbi:MAG: NIPSNAP family protein [Pirellulaceae bacterium]|nr:NIPSNAP family protein [Pirellulaceae bacterium]